MTYYLSPGEGFIQDNQSSEKYLIPGSFFLNGQPSTGTVTAILQGITGGRINFTGSSPTCLYIRIPRQYLQGVVSGLIQWGGLTPQDIVAVPTKLIEGILNGEVQFNGLSPLDLLTGNAPQFKSAASKLGLGQYSTVDVWSTPFAGYIASFDRKQQYADKKKDQLEELVRQYLAELDLLELQLQELQSYNTTAITKREMQQARREERKIVQELRKIKYRLLQQEDEEILLLLIGE